MERLKILKTLKTKEDFVNRTMEYIYLIEGRYGISKLGRTLLFYRGGKIKRVKP